MTTCTDISVNGLLSQPFSLPVSTSFYACAFASNQTQATECCGDTPQPFPDTCYSYCDLPSSLNTQFDLGTGPDAFSYMQSCLNATGDLVPALWCQAAPHIIPEIATTKPAPTSTFNADLFCATNDPLTLISSYDPLPECGVLPNGTNAEVLSECCYGMVVKWSVVHCYQYCGLPLQKPGNPPGPKIGYDAALGSFKTCLQQRGGDDAGLEGIICKVNGSGIDLKSTTFATTQYLTGSASGAEMVIVQLGLGMLIGLIGLIVVI
jgi:hypothetical protein